MRAWLAKRRHRKCLRRISDLEQVLRIGDLTHEYRNPDMNEWEVTLAIGEEIRIVTLHAWNASHAIDTVSQAALPAIVAVIAVRRLNT